MAWKRLIFLFLFFTSIAEAEEFKLNKILSLDVPWGSTFINNDELLVTEKSGVLNLGVEGMMLTGAVTGFVTLVITGSYILAFAFSSYSMASQFQLLSNSPIKSSVSH